MAQDAIILTFRPNTDELIPTILEPELTSNAFRQNWARLIQKIYPVEFPEGNLYSTGVYEVDPLIFPKCQGFMRIIAFIDVSEAIEKILKHIGLWDVKRKPAARANVYPPLEGPAD